MYIPVLFCFELVCVQMIYEQFSTSEFPYTLEDTIRVWNPSVQKVQTSCCLVNLQTVALCYGFYLRCKLKPFIIMQVVKRFLCEAVTRTDEDVFLPVEYDICKHSVEIVHAVFSETFVHGTYHLCVRCGAQGNI